MRQPGTGLNQANAIGKNVGCLQEQNIWRELSDLFSGQLIAQTALVELQTIILAYIF